MNKHTFRGLEAVLTFDNWPMLLLNRLCDRKTGMVIYRKNGYDILVDHRGGDECGTRMCIATNTYSKYLPLIHLSGPVRVLDLGANGGGFPLMLSIHGIQIAQVVAVEMNPLTFQRLRLNLLTNLGASAITLNAAVCAMQEGVDIPMKYMRGSTGQSLEFSKCETADSCISVASTNLPALVARYFENDYIDICKIDIEGMEFEVLESAPDSILQKMKCLIVELHYFQDASRAKAGALTERLESLGFSDITIRDTHNTSSATEVRAFSGPACRS